MSLAKPGGGAAKPAGERWLLVPLFGLIALLAWTKVTDPDAAFHLAAGRDIAARGAIPQTNVMGFTLPDAPWGSHQWLGSLLIYAAWSAGGFAGLGAAKVAAVCGMFALLLGAARREWPGTAARGWGGPILAGVFLAAAWAARPRFVERPLLLSALFEAALLWLLAGGRQLPVRRWLLRLVPLFVVWWNVHAGYVYGVLIVGAFVAGDALEPKRRAGAARLAAAALAAVAAAIAISALVNPGSLRGLRFPLEMFESPLFGTVIQEFRPARPAQDAELMLVLALGAAGFVASWARGRRPRAAHLLLFGGFAFLALSRVRMTLDACVVTAPLAAGYLAAAAPRRAPRAAPALAALAAAALVPLLIARTETVRFGHGLDPLTYPERAYDFVESADLPREMFTADLWSGTYLWRFHPDRRVYMHNQLEVYGERFWREAYLPVLGAEPGWQEILERRGVRAAMLRYTGERYKQRIADAMFADPRWTLVYWDDLAMILVRDTVMAERAREGRPLPAFRIVNPEQPDIAAIQAAGRGAEAERELRAVLARDAGCLRALSLLGELLSEAGRLPEARETWETMRTLATRRGERAAALAGLARVRLASRDAAGALELLDAALREKPGDPYLMGRRARALAEAGRREEARKEASELAGDARAAAATLVDLASAFADLKETASAQELFAAAVSKATAPMEAARAEMAAGAAWERAEEFALAEEAYRRARRRAPAWGDPANNLAWMLLRRGSERSAEALALAREAVALDPEDGYFWGTLGDAWLAAGRPDSALAALERARGLLRETDREALAHTVAGMERARAARHETEPTRVREDRP